MRVPNFEQLLELTGGFGRFQWLILFFLLTPEIPSSFIAFSPLFAAKPSNWFCELSNNETISMSKNEICGCKGRIFSNTSSIVSEWNLHCQYSWTSDFITSIQMFGMLVGSIFSSQISDWYGRRKTYLGVCILMGVGQFISASATSPYIYAFSRFLCGAGLSGFMGMSTIYPMEFLTPNRRLLCGSIGPWGEGVMILPIIAYFIPNWRILLCVTGSTFIFVVFTFLFVPESPRWLIRNRKFEEAQRVFKFIQKINNPSSTHHQDISLKLLEKIAEEEMEGCDKSRFTYLDFFRDPSLRKTTLVLMGIWFSWSLAYFGISFNIKNLRGNPYLNVFFMGLSDALGYPTALFANNRIGRRKSLILFMSLSAFFLVILAILTLLLGDTLDATLILALCLFGKFGVAAARSSARCLTSESFPTPIRTMGYGISGITAGVAGIIAPQVGFASKWWSPLPFVTFATISIIGSVLSLLIPETAGKTLLEKIGENIKIDVEEKKPLNIKKGSNNLKVPDFCQNNVLEINKYERH